MGIGYFNGLLFRIDFVDSNLFQGVVDGWWGYQDHVLDNISVLGNYIRRWYPGLNNRQRHQPHHVSPDINDRRCWHMGMLK